MDERYNQYVILMLCTDNLRAKILVVYNRGLRKIDDNVMATIKPIDLRPVASRDAANLQKKSCNFSHKH